VLYFVAIIGGDTLEAANSDRFLINAASAARRFARPITRSSEHAGKYVRFPVDHIRFGVFALSDQANVLGHGRVSWTGVLAVNDFVKVFGVGNICGFQGKIPRQRMIGALVF